MINKIAKKIFLSYLQTKNILLNKIINFSRTKANCLDKFFKNNLLVKDIVKYDIKFNLNEISQNFNDKEICINVIMFYVDKVDKKHYINGIMKKDFQQGIAQALEFNNKYYIVIYGSTNKESDCYSKKYFKQSFTHELMHFIDREIDQQYISNQFYFGHPLENFNDNNGVPYPGMYGDDDDIFDQKFAEYYTCKGEQKQYIFDLINCIEDYAELYNIKTQDFIFHIINVLNDKNKFMDLVNDFEKNDINYSPLAFIYHLTFSKQKNGNKQSAIKILKSLY